MVVRPSKEFLQEALTNNTFDMDSTDKALRITLDHSFSYLYRLQRNMVSYEEYFFTSRNNIDQPDYGDFYMDTRERICVNLPASLILQQFREKFRTSDYYKNLVEYDVLKTDHTLFARLPILLIDNRVVKSFSMDIYDDHFTAHLPFDRYFIRTKKFNNDRWEYEFVQHTTSLQVINNSFFVDFSTNTGMLQRNSYEGYGYNRILKSYLKDLGVDLSTDKVGTYFATVFLGNEELGSQLQEVYFDDSGDVVILFDDDTLKSLRKYTGAVTVRFYFYRYLYKYNSFRDDGYRINRMVQTRIKDDKVTSDIFLLQKENGDNYQLPIPTENLLIFKVNDKICNWNTHTHGEATHFPNKNVGIHYPNIYRFMDNMEQGDRFKVYYFYMPPYDLHYTYMYQFYYNYLRYKWDMYTLEETINRIFFGEMNYEGDPAFDELAQITAAVAANELVSNGAITNEQAGLFYNYALTTTDDDLESAKYNFVSGNVPATLSESEEEVEIPTRIEEFAKVFDFIINHEIVGYFYDEMDYLKNYEGKVHPFEYKVTKLKSFIEDDSNALMNYVRAQNKVGFKYEFSAKDIDLPSRYRTTTEDGKDLPEPMYLFTVQKPDPDENLSARIFIDGLMCATFIYDRYEFTDLIYVPEDYVKEDSYFEIEVFPCYMDKKVFTFSVDKPYCEVDFPSTENVTPTLSDVFFYLGEEDTLERLDSKKFAFELISTRYNYYVDSTKTIPIYYNGRNGVAIKGPYYNANGECFSFDGQRLYGNDISTSELGDRLVDGSLVEDVGYETGDHLDIVKASEVVTYDRVALGESTIIPDDNGVIYSYVTKVRITAKDISIYNQPVTIAIAKKPVFEGSKMATVSFPSFTTPIENSQNAEEYTRAFKNGRLLSKNRYDFTTIDGYLGIQMLEKLQKGETIAFDISPYRNRLVFYKEELDSDLVDLRGYINKPFDMKFYEVYLNGRRLNRTNVYPISPWEFKLAGTHSIYNLEIYEKDRDWEYYGADFGNYFTLSDFIRKSFMEKGLSDRLIYDITGPIPGNDNCEEKMPWGRELDLISVYFEMFYYMELVPMQFVSGDKNQFETSEISNRYPIIDQMFRKENDLGESVLLLSPDIIYKAEDDESDSETGTENEGDETETRVYLLGNPSLDNLDEI